MSLYHLIRTKQLEKIIYKLSKGLELDDKEKNIVKKIVEEKEKIKWLGKFKEHQRYGK